MNLCIDIIPKMKYDVGDRIGLELLYHDKLRQLNQLIMFTSQVKQLNQVYSNEGLDTAALECYGFTKEELTKMESSNEAGVILTTIVLLSALSIVMASQLFIFGVMVGLMKSTNQKESDLKQFGRTYNKLDKPRQKMVATYYNAEYKTHMKHTNDVAPVIVAISEVSKVVSELKDVHSYEKGDIKQLTATKKYILKCQSKLTAPKYYHYKKWDNVKGLTTSGAEFDRVRFKMRDDIKSMKAWCKRQHKVLSKIEQAKGAAPVAGGVVLDIVKCTEEYLKNAATIFCETRIQAIDLLETTLGDYSK